MKIFGKLKGKVIVDIKGLEKQSVEVVISFEDQSKITLYHDYNCCEDFWLEDFEFSGKDIVGATVLDLLVISESKIVDDWLSRTWTFYKIQTSKGELFLRWCGESNGYYSESVDVIYQDSRGECFQYYGGYE